MTDVESALKGLDAASASGVAADLPSLISEFDLALLTVDLLPEQAVDQLLALLNSPSFWKMDPSWKLLNVIRMNWGVVPEADHARLREVLSRSYGNYSDWMGAFVLAEIFGEKFADAEGLVALKQLEKTARGSARACLPHAFETFAGTTTDPELRLSTLETLRRLSNDPDTAVSGEAKKALAKVMRTN